MSIRANILYYFENHPNEKVFLKDLAAGVELEEKPVQSAVYQLMRSGLNLEVVTRGQVWIYNTQTEEAADPASYMSVVGMTHKGSCILEDSEGNFWLAKRFDE